MNKTYLLLLLLLLLSGAAFYFLSDNRSSTTNDLESDFAISNSDDIHKVFLADKRSQTATLVRNGRGWDYINKDGATFNVRANAIHNLLETVTKVKVRYTVGEANMEMAINDLSTNGIKVELYSKSGNRLKTYYVGGPSNDQQGTYMIMEDSDQPYVTHLGHWEGVLTPRFMLGEEDWRDKIVFKHDAKTIQSLSIEYPTKKNSSFMIDRIDEKTYNITPFYPSTKVIEKSVVHQKVDAYLYNYEKMVAEAFENKNPNKTKILNQLPFCIITLKLTNGEEKKVRIISIVQETNVTKSGKIVRPKVERFFAVVNDGEDFFLVQNLVFQKLFLGYDHFF